ncbi:MAG: CoA pyrophosphatase [Candidatus Korobacteraceae bacterium]
MTGETVQPTAAVAIVCAQSGSPAHPPLAGWGEKSQQSVLLIRRSEREDDSWSGHWSFPGGRRDPQDPDLLHTALRELREECGLALRREQMQAALPAVLARRRVGPYLWVAPFVFEVETELPTVLDTREAVEAVWIPRTLLLDPTRHCLQCVPRRPQEMRFPAIDLNGVPLWGFTYRLITDWLGLLPKQPPLEQPGFEAASLILDFLLAHGLVLKHGWQDHCPSPQEPQRQWLAQAPAQSGIFGPVVKQASVEGVIPVAEVLARFAIPSARFPIMNLLEVRPDHIRVSGLAFEEYLISAHRQAGSTPHQQ